jgi:hypothetical protein
MHHRRFRRIPFEAEVTLNVGRDSWSGELLDVALKGAMVGTKTPISLSLGTLCSLGITLPQTSVSLDFLAVLIHHEGNRYGFRFISENLETLTHLRRLIELNTGDTEATLCELSAWLCD